MKIRFFLLVIIALPVLLPACNVTNSITPPPPHGDPLAPTAVMVDPVEPTPTLHGDPLAPTPEVFIPLDPSPTPSGSDLPLTCQVTDLKVYIDPSAGYCFAYPKRFSMREFPILGVPAVQGPAIDNSPDAVAATFAVQVGPYDTNISLDQQVDKYLQEFTAASPETLTRSKLTVGGETAIQVDIVPVQLSWRLVFVPHEGQLYRLMYWPVDVPEAQADLAELYQTTLNSFAFLPSET